MVAGGASLQVEAQGPGEAQAADVRAEAGGGAGARREEGGVHDPAAQHHPQHQGKGKARAAGRAPSIPEYPNTCLLYTSDAADDTPC
eukprot:3304149-Pyramimonas_sp.AAC.1